MSETRSSVVVDMKVNGLAEALEKAQQLKGTLYEIRDIFAGLEEEKRILDIDRITNALTKRLKESALSFEADFVAMDTKKKERETFVKKVEAVVTSALPNILSLELKYKVASGIEYVLATCEGGGEYEICTEADSLIAMAADIINFLKTK